MRTESASGSGRTVIAGLCLAVMAVILARLAVVVPDWISGAPPAYPGQYLRRLYFALAMIPLLCVTLLGITAGRSRQPLWRRVLPWVLLGVSVVAMVLDARQG